MDSDLRSLRAELSEAIDAVTLTEKGSGDHFYGAWKGGSAKSGGGPSGGADGNPRTSAKEEAANRKDELDKRFGPFPQQGGSYRDRADYEANYGKDGQPTLADLYRQRHGTNLADDVAKATMHEPSIRPDGLWVPNKNDPTGRGGVMYGKGTDEYKAAVAKAPSGPGPKKGGTTPAEFRAAHARLQAEADAAQRAAAAAAQPGWKGTVGERNRLEREASDKAFEARAFAQKNNLR